MKQVYVSLGGNIGDTLAVMRQALQMIGEIEGIEELEVSRFFQATPVGSLPQDDFINAVCKFNTSLDVRSIHREFKRIEEALGKKPKMRDAPRIIDLDLLFYGDDAIDEEDLTIPHPRWEERLFVVKPLADLVETVTIPGKGELNIREMLTNFSNIHNETVTPVV